MLIFQIAHEAKSNPQAPGRQANMLDTACSGSSVVCVSVCVGGGEGVEAIVLSTERIAFPMLSSG